LISATVTVIAVTQHCITECYAAEPAACLKMKVKEASAVLKTKVVQRLRVGC
jgi:hypothetical protein